MVNQTKSQWAVSWDFLYEVKIVVKLSKKDIEWNFSKSLSISALNVRPCWMEIWNYRLDCKEILVIFYQIYHFYLGKWKINMNLVILCCGFPSVMLIQYRLILFSKKYQEFEKNIHITIHFLSRYDDGCLFSQNDCTLTHSR